MSNSQPQPYSPDATEQLVRAAADGDTRMVKTLLTAGASVNGSNHNGQTALIRAAFFGHVDIVRVLLAAGAETKAKDLVGLTALDWSRARGFPEIAELLKAAPEPAKRTEPPRPTTPASTMTSPGAEIPTKLLSEPIPGNPFAAPILSEPAPQSDMEEWTAPLETKESAGWAKPSEQFIQTVAEQYSVEPKTWKRSAPADFSVAPTQPRADPPTPIDTEKPADQKSTAANDILAKVESRSNQPLKEPAQPEPQKSTTQSRMNEPAKVATPPSPPRNIRQTLVSPAITAPVNVYAPTDLLTVKHCPKCFTEYNATQAYCARDSSRFAGILLGYFINSHWAGQTPPQLATITQPKSASAPEVKNSPIVEGIIKGTEVTVPEPEYPAAALRHGISGTIKVTVTVNGKGKVVSARPSKGPELLRKAAKAAALKAVFAPRKERHSLGTITYQFVKAEETAQKTESEPTTSTPAAAAKSPTVEGDIKGSEISVPNPDYTEAAKRKLDAGSVTVKIAVNKEGKVISVRALKGPSSVRKAAAKAARKAVFNAQPAARRSGAITYYFGPLGQS